jgi:dipeptidyl aminopeptidase/acylaminoacyl peptidase
MKRLFYFQIAFLALVLTFARAQTPLPARTASPLTPIAFLTAHEWEAKLPDSADGKKMKIHAQFTWSESRQAILINSKFVTDGKARPYTEGFYAWDPQQRVIAFWYVDAEGNLTKGTVKAEGEKLVHEFEQIKGDGKSYTFVAKVTPQGEQSWENEIFSRTGSELKPIVKVRYEIAE